MNFHIIGVYGISKSPSRKIFDKRNYLRKLLVITRRKNALGAEKSLIGLAYVLDQLIWVFEAA